MNAEQHGRAKELFQRALERPASERAAFVDAACGDDAELAEELRSLLAHHADATLVEAPAAAAPAPTTATQPDTDLPVVGRARFLATLRRPERRALLVGLAGLLLLAVLALLLESRIRGFLEDSVAARLETVRDMSVRELERWMDRETAAIAAWADTPRVREAVARRLAERAAGAPDDGPAMETLRRELALVTSMHRNGLFAVLDAEGRPLAWEADPQAAASTDDVDDVTLSARAVDVLHQALAGDTVLLPPYTSGAMLDDGAATSDEARMACVAPVRDDAGRPVAALAVAFDASSAFTDVLLGGRVGATGETYAVDRTGLFLSGSKFDDVLRASGRLGPDEVSMLRLRAERPRADGDPPSLTRAAGSVAAGERAVDVTGYDDYRGEPVVGAWTWLDHRGFGVITEIDQAQALGPLRPVHRLAWLLLGVLALALAWVVVSTWSRSRLQRTIADLGPYHLDALIGRGGMGAVYRARHALLRRPTAVKLLEPDKLSAEAIERFEREVQHTSALTHPNTVAIYDYGRSADDVFYYAMEYLPGPSLEALVARGGPLPVRRALHLVDQVCASLEEAHAKGLIHRDVKPGNVIVCERGGYADVAKLLDFGLVKAVDTADVPAGVDGRPASPERTSGQIMGTPLYMAPERITDPESVDARSDLYAVGGLLFKLVTGRDAFEGETVLAVIDQVLDAPPPRLGHHAPGPVPESLERLMAACLAKRPEDRPASATALRTALEQVADELGPWTEAEAEAAAAADASD